MPSGLILLFFLLVEPGVKLSKRAVTHLSRVAARMYLPLGENFTKDTGGLSSSEEDMQG